MLTLNATLPSQYSFLQDNNRCTRSRCALLIMFLLLTLSKLLSSEFMTDKSNENFLQKQLRNSGNYHKTVHYSAGILECISANPLARTYLKSEIVQYLALKESQLLINFVKTESLHKQLLRIYL